MRIKPWEPIENADQAWEEAMANLQVLRAEPNDKARRKELGRQLIQLAEWIAGGGTIPTANPWKMSVLEALDEDQGSCLKAIRDWGGFFASSVHPETGSVWVTNQTEGWWLSDAEVKALVLWAHEHEGWVILAREGE